VRFHDVAYQQLEHIAIYDIERDVGTTPATCPGQICCREQAPGHRRHRAVGDRKRGAQPARSPISGHLDRRCLDNAQTDKHVFDQPNLHPQIITQER
jgi:hypothetical protein